MSGSLVRFWLCYCCMVSLFAVAMDGENSGNDLDECRLLLGEKAHDAKSVQPAELDWSELPEDVLGSVIFFVRTSKYNHATQVGYCCPVESKVPVLIVPMICQRYNQVFKKFVLLEKRDQDREYSEFLLRGEKNHKIAKFLSRLQIPTLSLTAASCFFEGVTNCLFMSRYNNCRSYGCVQEPEDLNLIRTLQRIAAGGALVCSLATYTNIFAMLKYIDGSAHNGSVLDRRYGPCAWCYGLTPAKIIFLGTLASLVLGFCNDASYQYLGACISLSVYVGVVPISFLFSSLALCCCDRSCSCCPSCNRRQDEGDSCDCFCPDE